MHTTFEYDITLRIWMYSWFRIDNNGRFTDNNDESLDSRELLEHLNYYQLFRLWYLWIM